MTVFGFMSLGTKIAILGIGIVIILLFARNFSSKKDESNHTEDHGVGLDSGKEGVVEILQADQVITETRIDGGVSPAVVAAITSAIMMMTGKPATSFRLTSITRAGGTQPLWSVLGTNEIMLSRQRIFERGK